MKLPTLFIVTLTPLILLQETGLFASAMPSVMAAQEPTKEVEQGEKTNAAPPTVEEAAPEQAASTPEKPPLIDAPESPETGASPQAIGEQPRRRAEQRGRTYAPIGVPLSQQVVTGQVGITLRAAREQYAGLRDSRSDLSSPDAFSLGYAIAPTERRDQSYELEAMFGFNRRLDLFMVLPYSMHDMDQDLSLGGHSTIESSGLGDIQLGGVFRSYDKGSTRLSFMASLSLPTGEIDASDNYAGVSGATLPYAMQLGTGTFDLLPGVLLEKRLGDVQVGARAAGRIHLQGANDEGWFRSNSMRLDLWASKQLAKDLNGSLRAQTDWWGDLHGSNPDLVPLRNPLEDSLRQGGSRVTLYGGLSKDLNSEGNSRIEFELGMPVEEWLDGPALSQDWVAVIGWRLRF